MPNPTPTTTQDGGVVFGTQLATIPTGGAHVFVCENIKLKRPVKILDTHNQIGIRNKQALIPQKLSGTMQLQIPDSTTTCPVIGALFKLLPQGATAGNELNFIVSEPDEDQNQADPNHFNVAFVEQIN